MLNIITAIFEMVIAIMLWHRIAPYVRLTDFRKGLRTWCIALALSCFATNEFLLGIGAKTSTTMYLIAHGGLIVAGFLWLSKWREAKERHRHDCIIHKMVR